MTALSIRNMNHTLVELEQIEQARDAKAAERERVHAIAQEIRDRLTQEEYNQWWETTSEEGFAKEAELKLMSLQRDEFELFSEEWCTANDKIIDFLYNQGTSARGTRVIISGGEVLEIE